MDLKIQNTTHIYKDMSASLKNTRKTTITKENELVILEHFIDCFEESLN